MVWDVLLKKPADFNSINSYSTYSNIIEFLGITSFSEVQNSTLMWSHYADSHRGLVLEFAKDINNGLLTRNLVPVNYFESFPVINISDYPIEQMLAIPYQIICAKGKDWIYEREWRAISTSANCLNDYNKSELIGITFGLNTSEEDKRKYSIS
jgi:hypothetical protein